VTKNVPNINKCGTLHVYVHKDITDDKLGRMIVLIIIIVNCTHTYILYIDDYIIVWIIENIILIYLVIIIM
jgi:hypothetical protein